MKFPRLSHDDRWRSAIAAATLALILSLVGCSGKTNFGPDKDALRLFDLPKSKPTNMDRTRLRLIHQSRALYVHDDQSRVFDVFGPPPGATDVNDLPDGWDKDHFRVKGWEKGKDGFGVILADDNVALAMFTSEGKSVPDVNAILTDYVDTLGDPDTKVNNTDLNYYFWNTKGQRLMVATQRNEGEGIRVTQALGPSELMDALRMSDVAAKEDIARAHSIASKPSP